MKAEDVSDLGWINGYTVKPDNWRKCIAQNHRLEIKKIDRGAEQQTCNCCKLTWRVDYSG
jgi:hypothetical protein